MRGIENLIGGSGDDVLTGGNGDDFFVFVTAAESGIGANSDTITDFASAGIVGGDRINLSSLATGFVFIGAAGFVTGASNQIRVVVSGADTLFQLDTDADTGVESQIRLTGVHALTAVDFIV